MTVQWHYFLCIKTPIFSSLLQFSKAFFFFYQCLLIRKITTFWRKLWNTLLFGNTFPIISFYFKTLLLWLKLYFLPTYLSGLIFHYSPFLLNALVKPSSFSSTKMPDLFPSPYLCSPCLLCLKCPSSTYQHLHPPNPTQFQEPASTPSPLWRCACRRGS